MIARIHKSMQEKDKGFTLIELLVVMIIIGILAAIAIPVFLNQRKKANDTAATSDVSTLGKEVATYYVDATAQLTAQAFNGPSATAPTTYSIGSGAAQIQDIGKVSKNVVSARLSYDTTLPTPATLQDYSQHWCVEVDYSGGTGSIVSYSAQGGLQKNVACP
jgi:type IV pilus assembly protein PilA